MSDAAEIAARAADALAAGYARADQDHYCNQEIGDGETERCMDDAEHVAVCRVCGAGLRIAWRIDEHGVRWNRWIYSGLDGLLW